MYSNFIKKNLSNRHRFLQFILFLFTISFSLLSFQQTWGQNVNLNGYILDSETKEPLIGANILVGKNGCTSDSHGYYSINIPENTQQLIKVSYVGYKLYSETIKISKHKRLDLQLAPGIALSEVKVTAGVPIEKRVESSVFEIPVKTLKSLPMIGEPDILKSMQLLPGVQGGSDTRTGLFVRGGGSDQNLFLLDGTPIYHVNHIGGFLSTFQPDILKNVKFYKGGFPARYGGRLSSVVDLRMKEGNKKGHHGSYGIGIISGDLTLEGPIKKEKSSYIISLRRMWLDIFTRPITKLSTKHASMGYNFYDSFGKLSFELNPNNHLYLSAYGGDDNLSFLLNKTKEKVYGKHQVKWGNLLTTARWNHIFSHKLKNDVTFAFTRYRFAQNQDAENETGQTYKHYKTNVKDVQFKCDFQYFVNNKLTINSGLGCTLSSFLPGKIEQKEPSDEGNKINTIGTLKAVHSFQNHLYIENTYTVNKNLGINLGLRYTGLHTSEKTYHAIEPRFLTNLNIDNFGALKFSYTKMTQQVHLLTYSGSSFPTDIWLPSSKTVEPACSHQLSLGYAKTLFNNQFELSIELYQKQMKKLIEVKGGIPLINSGKWDENIEKNGTGTSKGIELFLNKKRGTTTGWVSYTLSKSDRQFAEISNGRSYPFKYDRRNDISIAINHQLEEGISFSASWVYGTGYPTTLYNGVISTPDISNLQSNSFSTEAYLYPGKNWLRMKAYHKLDLGFNFRKHKKNKNGKPIIRTWTVGVYNAYCRQNAVFYYYDYQKQSIKNPRVIYQQSGFPIIPSLKYSIEF